MPHHGPRWEDSFLTRRQLLSRMGNGFAALGLAGVLGEEAARADVHKSAAAMAPMSPKPAGLPGKAKRVIFLFMNGGPSHVDTFDPKPMLTKYHGQPLPYTNLPTERKTGTCYKSPFQFKKYGQSGIEVSEIFPHIAENIDDIAVIRSMHADV